MCSCWWLCLPLYELISCINTLVVKKKKNLPLTEELLLLYNIIGVLQNITSFLDVFTGGDTCFCFTYCTGVMLKTYPGKVAHKPDGWQLWHKLWPASERQEDSLITSCSLQQDRNRHYLCTLSNRSNDM